MFKVLMLSAAVLGLVLRGFAEDAPKAPLSDSEVWNAGLAWYEKGSNDLALATLRPLVLSRTHGPRAAEVVGKILFERAQKTAATDPAGAGKLREEALLDFQQALQKTPEDERANRNYTRAAAGIADLRRNAHVAEVEKQLANQDPAALLANAETTARRLQLEQLSVLTNPPVQAVAKSEALAREAERLSDVWIGVAKMITQSVTNEQQAATIMSDVSSARERTERAARELADMAPEAATTLRDTETACHRFHKLTAMPPDAADQGVLAQTNAYEDVATVNGRNWQQEALEWTRAFRARFPMWAQAYEQQAQSDTNKPPFTKEQQAEISALSTEVEKLQLECVKALLPPKQLEALQKLNRIRELLPKDGKGGSNDPQNRQQRNDKNEQNQQQNQKDQAQNRQQQQNHDQAKRNPQDDKRQDEQQENKPQERQAEESEDKPKDDPAVDDVLRKAQERSDEHEQEKKARANKVPLPANERDW